MTNHIISMRGHGHGPGFFFHISNSSLHGIESTTFCGLCGFLSVNHAHVSLNLCKWPGSELT